MNYKVVFDIADAGYKSWTFPAFGFIFVCIGIVLIVSRKYAPWLWRGNSTMKSVFPIIYFSGATLWTLVTFLATYSDYSALSSAQKTGRTQIVEGPVHDFVPMPVTGHSQERFCVSTRCFEYSDYGVTAGFNNTSSHGGPVRDNLQVRVTYVGNEIAKLEVAR